MQTKVSNLEEKTNQLAQQQFSPTAKFTGEIIFNDAIYTGTLRTTFTF